MQPGGTDLLDGLATHQDPVRVLLVEDDAGDTALVTDLLSEGGEGIVVTACTRLADAEAPLAAGLADLVLLDLELPDARGLDGLRRLRAIAPDVPVVVLSGGASDRVALEAVQAGAQDALAKGDVRPDVLGRAVRYAVERQRTDRRLAQLALRDPLTGLPNRVLLADRLEQTMARGRRRGPVRQGDAGLVLLMVVDIDGFAAVNAAHGHAHGDRLLVELADRLRRHLREGDTVARLGGDELCVIVEDVTDEVAGLRLAERLAALVTGERPALELSVSIGMAVADPAAERGAEALARADDAVRAAKRIGPGRCQMADPAVSVR